MAVHHEGQANGDAEDDFFVLGLVSVGEEIGGDFGGAPDVDQTKGDACCLTGHRIVYIIFLTLCKNMVIRGDLSRVCF